MHEEPALRHFSVHVPGRAQGGIKVIVPVLVKGVLCPGNLVLEAIVQHLGRHCTQECCQSKALYLARLVREALIHPAEPLPQTEIQRLIPRYAN